MREIIQLRNEVRMLREQLRDATQALDFIGDLIGPGSCEANQCLGCRREMEQAGVVARAAARRNRVMPTEAEQIWDQFRRKELRAG